MSSFLIKNKNKNKKREKRRPSSMNEFGVKQFLCLLVLSMIQNVI